MFKLTILLLPLFFLCISGQELLQISTLHDQDPTLAVSVNQEKLHDVSSSILMAENWLRTHVLSIYPSTNITSIIVFNRPQCDDNNQEQIASAKQNVYHSLIRWGLERKIRVSVRFAPKCLHQAHDFQMRKLLSESDYSVPSDAAAAAAPLPPLIGVTPQPLPPGLSVPLAPIMQPAQSPYGHHLPPCNPNPTPPAPGAMAAAPVAVERMWCVAKPSVPVEKLQEGMDYACGEGGADCGAIGPAGSCYFPDSVYAHASYAFNSYWQKNKKNGGTCGFGGTAMLINSDPSFLECHFTLA